MSAEAQKPARARAWKAAAGVGALILAANLVLVALAGTDIPIFDQWDAHGARLLPAWRDGSLEWADLLAAHNEHRIVWTHLVTLGLFVANGQWDPLVELVAGAGIRAMAVGAVAWWLVRGGAGARWAAIWTGLAFFPAIGWHNVLWGFQSQVFFSVGLGAVTIGLLATGESSWRRIAVGLTTGLAALLAMGPSALMPLALLGIAGLRSWEERRILWRRVVPALVLLVAGALLRESTPGHEGLKAGGLTEFAEALGRAAGWPHVAQPAAAVVMNLPLAWWALRRLRRREQREGEREGGDFVLALGGWGIAMAVAAAWRRGGSEEWAFGVPSRYADLLALQLVANAWCLTELVRIVPAQRAVLARWLKVAWIAFAGVGLAGGTAEAIRKVIVPRAQQREAPVLLAVAFQQTRDPRVFEGRWRTILPHVNAGSVAAVLDDPRMEGALPPSLQPERPRGPLSRWTRVLLGRD